MSIITIMDIKSATLAEKKKSNIIKHLVTSVLKEVSAHD